jgi:hypothetical protein
MQFQSNIVMATHNTAAYGSYGVPSNLSSKPLQQIVVGSARPVAVSPAVQGAPAPPPDLPPGARYSGTITDPNTGALIDRYVVPQRGAVPVRQVVPEVQTYQVVGETTVQETRQVQVPAQKMVEVEETVMVPQVRKRLVPQTYMTTQTITVSRPVKTVQNMQRTVHKVIEGQKIVESEQIIEYERPKIISGRYLGTQQAGVREVGVQWKSHFYQDSGEAPKTVSPPVQVEPRGAQSLLVASPRGVALGSVPPAQAPVSYIPTSPNGGVAASPYGNFSSQGYAQNYATADY